MKKGNSSLFFTDSESAESYSLSNQFAENMEFRLVKDRNTATPYDFYYATAMAVKDNLVRKWLRTQNTYNENDTKRVYYLSMEFLIGRLLKNMLTNLSYDEKLAEILERDGLKLEDIVEAEEDMGLGNGGLGRLAACFLDSMATLKLPAFGYGIRYEYGIFKQLIDNGYQVEQPDHWLATGNPWETLRREINYRIKYFGKVISHKDDKGNLWFDWVDTEDVIAMGYDIPVPGYNTDNVNNLRLWAARSTDEFSFQEFNRGNYLQAVENKSTDENISKVLYPNDSYAQGKILRLKQEYFFVSASLQDIIRKYKINHSSMADFAEKTAIQLNDTHPVIAIPELMRILLDEEKLDWDEAWKITTETFAYTNHTVVPEALEEWSVNILELLLPRHLDIIYEINHRFLKYVKQYYTADDEIVSEISLIKEGKEKFVRMAYLAIVGSHHVNGVAALHTEILKNRIFKHFHKIFPGKFVNVTNGITPRRWLRTANPKLAELITNKIGSSWAKNLSDLRKLEDFTNDKKFLKDWQDIKLENKKKLKDYIESEHNIKVNINSIFDIQIKRFHEYKRQLLNVLHVIDLYIQIRENPDKEFTPRTVIFGGKAAPAYLQAKMVIKLINNVADVINNDPQVGDKLKIVFLKNYSVSLAELLIPAADLSEQISTAGFEASGTGNMKFALNGALTIGTMDGANVEMAEEIGEENMFIFGLLSDEVVKLKESGYDPKEYYDANPRLQRVVSTIRENCFSRNEEGIFSELIQGLDTIDYYCLYADFDAYLAAQRKVDELFLDKTEWAKKSIINSARMGKFSSDRSIEDYNRMVWKAEPIEVNHK